ncbi:MAG TPA: hypothetical protein VM266_06950 [Solirubrobacteraceae bacterium]|nr:hypothetical protein [Solirubrobacteraceae bacterium]
MQVHTLPVPGLRDQRTGRYAPDTHELQRDELYVLWSAARAEANIALDDWRDVPGAATYAAYRAAEDRADAAQDALAALA